MATYRKTSKGEWVVMAPVTELQVGATIAVATKSGAVKHERISRVGRAFTVDGVEMAYGYPLRGTSRVEVDGVVYRQARGYRRRENLEYHTDIDAMV